MKTGTVIGKRYRIIKPLGEGGMASVFLAEDTLVHRKVTIKLLRLDLQEDHDAITRFEREAATLRKIDDDHIVKVYDVGIEKGVNYLVMEYVAGCDLKQYIAKHKPLAVRDAVLIMQQILTGVQAAHQAGIIHRDLKPQNILIEPSGLVKITDFGIAVALAENSLTLTNTLLGSVHYISPEQARGLRVTAQSDIYSLGIILYELLTGQVPYQGETAVAVALKHFRSAMPLASAINPNVPQAVENVILKATAKDPHQRYADVAAFKRDLKTSLAHRRRHEKRWQPTIKAADEVTKIIPNIHQKMEKLAAEQTQAYKIKPVSQAYPVWHPKRFDVRHWRTWSRKKKTVVAGASAFLALTLIGAGVAVATIPKNVQIPTLSGMTPSAAKRTLTNLKVKVKTVSYHYDRFYYAGQVIGTTPKAGTRVRQHSQVTLVVSKGSTELHRKSYVGASYSAVCRQLRSQGVAVQVAYQYSTQPKGAIIRQTTPNLSHANYHQVVVRFVVSRGKQHFKVADLRGHSLTYVRKYIAAHHLHLRVQSQNVGLGQTAVVVKQTPQASSKVATGATVTVVVKSKN